MRQMSHNGSYTGRIVINILKEGQNDLGHLSIYCKNSNPPIKNQNLFPVRYG